MISNKKISSSLMTRKSITNESGMILLVASAFIMAISVVVIGLLNRNVTQALSSHAQYKQLQAEQLARGAWWRVYDNLNRGTAVFPTVYTVTFNEVNNTLTYTITVTDLGLDAQNRHQYRVRVTY
jgi:hypothetical protein